MNELEVKLKKLQLVQNWMKKINEYYVKYKTLDGCELINITQKQILEKSLFENERKKKPFESDVLMRNNQSIRNLKMTIKNTPICQLEE